LETLGFKLGDIKILLTTQAHYDHVGALAEIKKLTGAKMFADVGDVEALQDGGRSDYALTDSSSLYTPIGVDRVLYDRQTIRLGEMQILMLHHPGHTRGSCSYILRVKDDNRSYKILIANMPSIIIDIPFSQVKTYPNIARDYAHTLTAMKKLSFDLWLASHASQFDLHRKHKPGKVYNPLAFMDRKGYEDELNDLKKKYWRKLKDEKY
jgi:metallo-beta-lactamase class B